jgi:ABC-type hemin transport system ATPase subunit
LKETPTIQNLPHAQPAHDLNLADQADVIIHLEKGKISKLTHLQKINF